MKFDLGVSLMLPFLDPPMLIEKNCSFLEYSSLLQVQYLVLTIPFRTQFVMLM